MVLETGGIELEQIANLMDSPAIDISKHQGKQLEKNDNNRIK